MTELVNRNTSIACETDSLPPLLKRLESSRDDFKDSLTAAVSAHLSNERVSFHTPGHKGRVLETARNSFAGADFKPQYDVTELTGLDDLSAPSGAINRICERASRLWCSQNSILSVNGATAGMLAAILSLSVRGQKLLVPRNAHRSVINALVLSGLTPVWYEPEWNQQWKVYTGVKPDSIKELLRTETGCAGLVVVSPTYGGAISDISALSAIVHEHSIPLIVDEAHGAHFLADTGMPASAIATGADIVVHSLHKTLGALTQTGTIHIGANSLIDAQSVQVALNLIQSSSPSYPLMLSIESTLDSLSGDRGADLVQVLFKRGQSFRESIARLGAYDVYEAGPGSDRKNPSSVNPTHILISHHHQPAERLHEALAAQGIFAETILGNGVLLMLGIGTSDEDLDIAVAALQTFDSQYRANARLNHIATNEELTHAEHPARIEQMINPRIAATAPSHLVPISQAENHIAAECIAPCPPGIPLCVPGQKLTKEVLKQITKDRVRIVS